jgi:4-hydroxy-3-methylbut-2-en-1-yl diphosphate reductase
MKVEIDTGAGFCFGVEKTIKMAEKELAENGQINCLGEIVHNEAEINRLEDKGMVTVPHDDFNKLKNTTVLIRAHGEPPETYNKAKQDNITIIEATCPVVLKLQSRVRDAFRRMSEVNGQVLIAGKKNHPEIIGLAGQTGYQAIIIEQEKDADRVDYSRPAELFAQTTLGVEKFRKIQEIITERSREAGNTGIKVHNTFCGQVSNRVPGLIRFCKDHDVIIFVSGKNSSNGKALFEACRNVNPRSYHLSSPDEFDPAWINGAETVGISGSTSTPRWLMQKVAKKISRL